MNWIMLNVYSMRVTLIGTANIKDSFGKALRILESRSITGQFYKTSTGIKLQLTSLASLEGHVQLFTIRWTQCENNNKTERRAVKKDEDDTFHWS